jgi:septal ring factor EnvC (AmiA/AmiB activator)
LNAVLGAAGDTIYFEIRVENRPEDPALWLR